MHFYTNEGKPMHTIIGKNGKERTTSIADARKLGLFPSVTTIMDVQAKQALIQWLQQQLLDAAVANPYHPHEWDEQDWRKAMIRQMKAKGEAAAKRGTEIHGYLDQFFNGGAGQNISFKQLKYINPAIELITEIFGSEGWVSEQSFCKLEHGFAGCVDLHHPTKNIIIDFKTKDKENLKGVTQYEDHKIQLAAYQLGLGMHTARRFNLFISTSEKSPGVCKLVECTEYDRYASLFSALQQVWCLKNNYFPQQCDVYV